MTVKLHGHAELSQYEILDLFVIQYISESRNINIDLYKGDNIYALRSIKISRQRSNCKHNYYHGKGFVISLDILVTWIAMMCC
ncbi:transmembrane protein, putative [Medicago truncatula]|uniref:Transmembrane protein, putative n=1 Tax=Medicago truncatula TaxID=3880 RepID=G7L3P3_MEDTR|nr:transmembrane protein, putative [Medicago truncatula]